MTTTMPREITLDLGALVREYGGVLRPSATAPAAVSRVEIDSRRAGPGVLFVALPGTRANGARFAAEALGCGASAVLAPRDVPGIHPLWIHSDARSVAGRVAARLLGDPALEQRVVAVTGTNGKSTVAHLVGRLLAHLGHRPAIVGTVEVRLWGEAPRVATHTTPDAPTLQRLARENRERGGDAFVLEASSHALDQERLAGLALDAAVFTNLGHDHLDYHADLEAYAAAKERIFEHTKADGAAILNADDPACARMARAARAAGARVLTYGTGSSVDLSATPTDVGPSGTTMFLEGMGIPRTGLFLPLVGRHNVENALAAAAAVLSFGASPSALLEGLASLTAPRGRLEPVDTGERGFRVFVDYAHTPEALERVLTTLRGLLVPAGPAGPARPAGEHGRLLCVFGCGGSRDRAKRGPMGAAVGRLADIALVTSDNPREEEPSEIIEEILPGLAGRRAAVQVEPDRRRAIGCALREARPGDIVLVAGRGHEAWQQLRNNERVPFEDSRVVLEELR